MVPVNLSDIHQICEFIHLDPLRFPELVAPDESLAHAYREVPEMESEAERSKVPCLKEVGGGCVFPGGGKCSTYDARPLRCRPFPFSYERREGEIVFTVNEEALGFFEGLSEESEELDFVELRKTVRETEKEQEVSLRRVKDWNKKTVARGSASYTLSDFLKFTLPHIRYAHSSSAGDMS